MSQEGFELSTLDHEEGHVRLDLQRRWQDLVGANDTVAVQVQPGMLPHACCCRWASATSL